MPDRLVPERLVVVTALAVEARAVRRGLRDTPLHVCGMGPRRAGHFGRGLRTEAAIAVVGFAGSLTSTLRPGQVVVATRVVHGDTTVELPSASLVAAHLRQLGVDVVSGPIVSTPSIVRGSARGELHETTGAIAVDNESAFLLAEWRDVDPRRLAVVRVISDSPDHELFSPGTIVRGVRGARVMRRIGPALTAWAGALGPRRVVLAGPRSFCAGVERAIDIVQRAIDRFGAPVYVRRQIVHNSHVVQDLETAGAVFVQELDEVPEGATVVLAAHGVAPEVRRDAESRNLRVVDATCPLVAKVHTEARRYARDGYSIVLVGHVEHEEVIGTLGEAPDRIVVVEGADDVDDLDLPDATRVAFLTQTTLALDDTASVVGALKARFPDAVGPRGDDICYASQNRQQAVRAVAEECDVVLVLGSANSSNSKRLVEVAQRAGCDAHLIENDTELDLRWLDGARTIGVSAGASAPEFLVTGVVDALARLGPVEVTEHTVVVENVRFNLPTEVR
jgi:4-hydroxy-3-methylbut-2-enyl diphosphate reductase